MLLLRLRLRLLLCGGYSAAATAAAAAAAMLGGCRGYARRLRTAAKEERLVCRRATRPAGLSAVLARRASSA